MCRVIPPKLSDFGKDNNKLTTVGVVQICGDDDRPTVTPKWSFTPVPKKKKFDFS